MNVRPTRVECILGPGYTAEVSCRRGEEMGKSSVKMDHKREKQKV